MTTAQTLFSIALGAITVFITFFAVYVTSRTLGSGNKMYKPKPPADKDAQ